MPKYDAGHAAYLIACAIHVPVEAGNVSAACRELLYDIYLACEDRGLPTSPIHDSRGLTKVALPLLGSTMELVTTGLTLRVWFTEAGRRHFRDIDLTYDAANGKMVGPNGTDAATAVAAKLSNIALELNVSAEYITAFRARKASV